MVTSHIALLSEGRHPEVDVTATISTITSVEGFSQRVVESGVVPQNVCFVSREVKLSSSLSAVAKLRLFT